MKRLTYIRRTDGSGFAQSEDTSWLYAISRCENSTHKGRSARLCPLCLPQW
uniref:Uncharacterized protein n=1 Tax=Wuchereria bancrofti TaxID=6293 RepID=A0AAF5RY29_WUCBA